MAQSSLQGDSTDSRKLGLEYALRQHPWATPGAEGSGIIAPDQSDAPVQLSRQDPVASLISYLENRRTPESQFGVYHVTTVGQYFIRPAILVQSISNLVDQNIVVVLAEGERLPGRTSLRVGLIANTLPVTGLRWHFSRALVVRQIYTTTGASATASLLIGGTWAAGQVYSATITSPNPADPTGAPLTVTLAYTTVVGDANNAGAAASFAAAWNANLTLASLATASVPSGSIVLLTAVNPGSLIMQSTVSTSATGTGTFTVTSPFAGAANPSAGIAFE
jgi:hypothetical protein